jgi:hypothetical protein
MDTYPHPRQVIPQLELEGKRIAYESGDGLRAAVIHRTAVPHKSLGDDQRFGLEVLVRIF